MTMVRPFTKARIAAVFALMLLAAGCAGERPLYVPYGGSTYGYADRATGPDTYEVTYRAPIYTTYAYGRATRDRVVADQTAMAHDMALLRAADLAQTRNMPAFRELNRDNDVRVDVEDDPFYDPWGYRGYPCRTCGPGFYPAPYYSRDRRTVVDVTVRVQVRVEPRLSTGAYNVNEVQQKILAAYPQALPKAAPQRVPGGPIGSFNAPAPPSPAPSGGTAQPAQ
ncbi:MAG: CC0125/CC1285 family lipoprotein [Gemmatimonas sp.]